MSDAQISIDASDYARMARDLERLPQHLRHQVASRSMRRIESMVKTRLVRRSAERVKLPVGKVAAKVRQAGFAEDLTYVFRSDWTPLIELGAKQTRTGVSVKARGSYRSAFIAVMNSKGVFQRKGAARTPTMELYGPNPANDIVNNGDVYVTVLEDLIASHLLPRVMHELSRAFG